jgi:transcription initiation factor IIE alpha subunit
MEILYELNCDNCGAEYELLIQEDKNDKPQYCPFCGSEVDLSDVDEEFEEDDDFMDELDFDDDK